MKYFNHIFKSLLTLLVFIPQVLFAAGPSVIFSQTPTVVFQTSANGVVSGTLSGSVLLGGTLTMDNVLVAVAISNTPIDPNTVTSSQLGFFGSSNPADSDFSANNSFSSVLGNTYQPGQTYYFFFETDLDVDPQPVDLVLDSEMISATVPLAGGGNNSGNNDNPNNPNPNNDPNNPVPPCPPNTLPEDCPTTPDPGDIPYPWPSNLIDNPLSVDNLNSFIVGLLNALLKIGIPIMVIFLVYSGLRLVMARGNEKELEDAKKNLLWVIIGIAILLCAWTIVKILKGTLDQIDITYINNLLDHFV